MSNRKLLTLVNRDFISMSAKDTVKDALKKWRKLVYPSKVSHIVYIIDDENYLVGIVDLRELFVETSSTKMKEIMNKNFFYVNEKDHMSNAASLIIEKRISEVPLLDKKGKLIGIVIAEDLLNAMRWNHIKTIYRLAGMIKSNEKVTFDLKHINAMFWERAPWLVVSVLFLVFFAGGLIKNFESAIAAVPAIAFFMPVLMATGGNISTQTTTIFVRYLSSRDPAILRQIFRLFAMDLAVGNLMGVLLGCIVVLSSALLFPVWSMSLTLIISIILIANFSVCIGFIVPFLCAHTKVDPAMLAGPFSLIIQDVVSLGIYFGVLHLIYF